jgi:hypothetical protein
VLGSHGRCLSRQVTLHLASDTATGEQNRWSGRRQGGSGLDHRAAQHDGSLDVKVEL